MSGWRCGCVQVHPRARLVVVTGGPGAGKTAVLELLRHRVCEHVVILPEAAGIVFGGQLLHQMEQERLAATSSPAAQALQAQDVRLTEEARRQAAAASRTVAGGAPMQAPARKPLPKPGTRRADGSLKSPTEYRIEQEQWMASQAR